MVRDDRDADCSPYAYNATRLLTPVFRLLSSPSCVVPSVSAHNDVVLLALALMFVAPTNSRQIVDLDPGWEFVRVPNPPTIWSGPDAVPTSSWRVMSVSSQEINGENGRASNAFDGNPKTIWHTEWSKRQTQFPHELIVDLGSRVEAMGFRMLPRQTSPNNGRPNHFQLFLSNDWKNWGTPVLNDSAANSSNLYVHLFPATTGRYMRLVFKDGHLPEPFLALSEIGLIRKVSSKDQKDWSSQYNIATVQVGGDRFDLKGADLEKAKADELSLAKSQHWESATLPHAAWTRPLGTSDIWQGVAFYRRTLNRPVGSLGKLVNLTIEGAMQTSDLWLNGKHIATRHGGYLPMVVDLTPSLRDRNELLVRVDNRDNPLVPPGKAQQDLDFMYGNGIYRNAYLTVTDRVSITDPILENAAKSGGVYVTFPKVNDASAIVRIRTHVRNSKSLNVDAVVTQRLLDARNDVVAMATYPASLKSGEGKQISVDLVVTKPRLWSPDSPNLYRLTSTISEGAQVLDQIETSIGIRSVEVSRQNGFVLNGRPIRLIGTNRHQDYPWVGPALSDAANARDAIQIRRAGHNIVRLSHYPQSPAFLDACDRVGLMVIPCIPGWQFMNKDSRFVSRVAQDIRELIRRDRNHPCVAFWETSLNETYPPVSIARQWDAVAKSESLDRCILTAGDAATGAPWDVAYNQWKDDLSRPQDAAPDKPGYIREYGDYEFGGATSTSRVQIGDGMDKLLQETWNHVWSDNKFRPQYPWTMGNGTWEMFDTNVPWEFKVSACGLSDLFRRPKPSYWYFASQSSKRPMVKIAATWQPGKPKRDIVVLTNCDVVSLYINGRQILTGKPQRNPSTDYQSARPFDGSNTENLPHPPIVFRDVPFVTGTLNALGVNGGRAVTNDTVTTSGKPEHLRVWIDTLGVAPQRNDLVFIRASVVDGRGNACTDEVRRIRFRVEGDAWLAGESTVQTQMGMASALIRTSPTANHFSVNAESTDHLVGTTSMTISQSKLDSK